MRKVHKLQFIVTYSGGSEIIVDELLEDFSLWYSEQQRNDGSKN